MCVKRYLTICRALLNNMWSIALQVPLCSVAVSSLPNYSMAGSFVCNQELGEDLPPNLYLRTYVCSICDKCECGEVQDEKHVLFFCKCAEVCELRMRYRDRFERMFKTLCVFAPSSSEFIPFLTCHHSITDFEIMHSLIETHTDSSSLCQI